MIQKSLIKVHVDHHDILRQNSLGDAIDLCVRSSGLEPKQVAGAAGNRDNSQYSRWVNNQEGVKWEKLQAVMDVCGNDVPLLWMLSQRGYDLSSLRMTETETEKALRHEQEARVKVEQENQLLRSLLRGAA